MKHLFVFDGRRGAPAGEGDAVSQEDELFAHLELLMEQLPRMQELNARFEKAVEAEKVVRAVREQHACEAVLADADAGLAKEQEALKQAVDVGDDENAIKRHQLGVVFFSQQRGFRVGPAENARIALRQALEASPFATLEEAQAAALEKGELEELGRELTAYRADYDATFSACQRIESAAE